MKFIPEIRTGSYRARV